MTAHLGIIADDLTGALDTAAPFAARGLRTVAALVPEAIPAALMQNADIVSLNSLSRHLSAGAAGEAAGRAAALAQAAGVAVPFKKIDSRFRGQPVTESEAVARAFGRSRLLLAPAVPTQQRHVHNGCIVGHGVGQRGIDMRGPTQGRAMAWQIPDTADDDSLAYWAAHVLTADTDCLAVGAHGLGVALATHLGRRPTEFADAPSPTGPVVVVAGSQDPVTAAQLDMLVTCQGVAMISCRDGRVPTAEIGAAPVLVLVSCASVKAAPDPDVGRRFTAAAAPWVAARKPARLIIVGGDTAADLLAGMDCTLVQVQGEVAPGLPRSTVLSGPWQGLDLITKSGGFGDVQTLARLIS
jgi:D-threonate/D-erythronate kinase